MAQVSSNELSSHWYTLQCQYMQMQSIPHQNPGSTS